METRIKILKINVSAMFLAIGLILPFLTGQIQTLGQMLSPMHIPVFICAFVCGWKYALVVGFSLPLLRSFIFGMPVLYPGALAMSFELAAYGLIAGVCYNIFRKVFKNNFLKIYPSLIISMIGGRIIWGVVRYLLTLIDHTLMFNLETFISGAILTVWPGMILHLIIVPLLVIILEKLNLFSKLR